CSMQSHNSFIRRHISFVYPVVVLCAIAGSVFAQQTPPPDSKAAAPSQATGWQQTTPDSAKATLPPGLDPKTMRPLYESIQEDWSSLAIGASKLEPEPPLVALTE